MVGASGLPGFDLHRLAAGFLQHADRGHEGLLGRGLERAKRQIDHDKRMR